MFSTGISYNEAESAIQKLDPSMRADYEKSLSDLRKAETVYAEEGRQAISYMGLALNLENSMQELAATKSLLDQEREKCQFLDRSIFPMLLLLCGFLSAFIIPLLAHSLFFSPLLAVAGSIAFSVILSLIGIVYTYGISEHLGKDPDFYLLYKSSQKVKLAFFVLLPLMVETIYGILNISAANHKKIPGTNVPRKKGLLWFLFVGVSLPKSLILHPRSCLAISTATSRIV